MLEEKRRVDLDVELLREEVAPGDEGEPARTRFSIPLKGDFGVTWIESFYRLQWAGLDDVGLHISKNCREIYFDRPMEPKTSDGLSSAVGELRNFIGLVNSEAEAESRAA